MNSKEIVQRLVPESTAALFKMCGQWHIVGIGSYVEDGIRKNICRILSGGFDSEDLAWNDAVRVIQELSLGLTPNLPCSEFPAIPVQRLHVPRGSYLDHIDGDPTNNDPSNLRVVTLAKNRGNHV